VGRGEIPTEKKSPLPLSWGKPIRGGCLVWFLITGGVPSKNRGHVLGDKRRFRQGSFALVAEKKGATHSHQKKGETQRRAALFIKR